MIAERAADLILLGDLLDGQTSLDYPTDRSDDDQDDDDQLLDAKQPLQLVNNSIASLEQE